MATSNQKAPSGQDAIALLMADHKQVKDLFAQYKALKAKGSDAKKRALVEQICNALTVHTDIEEEIFYPAIREAIDDADLMDEALVEHAGAKDLVAQLQDMEPDEDLYDAKVTVLGEQVDHHVEEEEGEMFPKAKKANVDTLELGAKMAQRKEELMEELGDSDDEDEDDEEEDEGEDEDDEEEDEE